MQKNSLTLCLIVRNEEETVGRAIKSALAVVDEVVVVDTGSTDNTRLIVEGYGARVIDFPWCDDFSAARNAGLAAAYGDWILILDADEVLESIRPVEMNRLLSNEEAIAYFARIRNEAHGCQSTVYDKIRLFRNHPDIRYRFPIHEQITPSIAAVAERNDGKFMPSGISIVHYGSVDRQEKGKKSRNQRLLRRAIQEHPEEAYFHYQLACEMALHLDERVLPVRGFSKMTRELQAAVDLVSRMPLSSASQLGYGSDLYARLSGALLAQEKNDEALKVVQEGIRFFGNTSLLTFTHGRIQLVLAQQAPDQREERLLQARRCMSMMLERSEKLEPAPVSDAYFTLYPLYYLGALALEEGQVEQARKHFIEALEVDSSYTQALCGLARLAAREGRAKEALQIYLKALNTNESEVSAWIGGAEVLIELGFQDNALSWLQKLSSFLPEDPRLGRMMKQLKAQQGVFAGQ